MRINNRILVNSVLSDLNKNMEDLLEVQRQMSSGKTISRPSDNPVTISQVLTYKSVLHGQEQYIKNMEEAREWVDTSEQALSYATNVMQRARELAIYGSNDTMPQSSREALAAEVDQLLKEMVEIANTSYGGRYVFGGTSTSSLPFSLASGSTVNYNGDDGRLEWEISSGVTIPVNLHGQEIFVDAGVFQSIINLRDRLISGIEIDRSIGEIDEILDGFLSHRAELGAKSKRLEMSLERAEEFNVSITKLLSHEEDVDLAEVAMNFKLRENAYRAALMTGAQIIQPSLLDFLR